MRTTLAVDDVLLNRAQALTGITEKSALVRQALTAFVARESARGLALLGGSDQAVWAPLRRQAEAV
jgi:Arc/MetJ family transcription regulator